MLASLGNVLACMDGSLSGLGERTHRSKPIKRVPGLALPCHWLRVDGELVPLHLLDLCLHLFHAWPLGEAALTFYIPKLENEVEAAYLAALIRTAESLLPAAYKRGSVRLLVVLEDPRAVFRVNEIMDALFPYFAGASLGWHDYVAAAARLFRNDPSYRMPAKADPQIVVKHIRESHLLLSRVVKARGGVAIGGMYGVLPVNAGQPVQSDSMQVCIRGIIRDIVVQLRRGLDGLWVAHPDFVRLATAVVLAFRKGKDSLRALVTALVTDTAAANALLDSSIADSPGLDPSSPLYARALLAAEMDGAASSIQNNDEEEIRYNTFQALQYLTDWLMGRGCVALPAELPHPNGTTHLGIAVRVMDDLATTERSRWEVALEVAHGRVSLEDAVRIAREEMLFFRTGGKYSRGSGSRAAAVPWHDVWSPIAYRIWVLLVSSPSPVSCINFATELLLPFTISSIRNSGSDVWQTVARTNPKKYAFSRRVQLLDALYAACLSPKVVELALRNGTVSGASVPAEDQHRVSVADQTLTSLDPIVFPNTTCVASRVKAALAHFQASSGVAPEGRWLLAAQRSTADGGGCFFRSGLPNLDAQKDRVQIASLSKPIGSAFAIEYFAQHRIALSTSVASLLRRLGSPFVLEAAAGCPAEWAEEVILEHLMCHCSGLGQHYVHSMPARSMPSLVQLMHGFKTDLGGEYRRLQVERKPGTSFAYSGGAFILLQHVLELHSGKQINDLMAPFLRALGMQRAARMQDDGSGALTPGVAEGRLVERRTFPGIAAGAVCSPGDTLNFLRHLVAAFDPRNAAHGSGPISHDTAVRMLGAPRRQISAAAREFIACDVGCGLFIGECGDNWIAVHQGANEGYRGLFVACCKGPAAGAVVVCMAASDAESVPAITSVARTALLELGVLSAEAVERLARATFAAEGVPQETIVNQSMKSLLFGAFVRTPLPPPPRLSQSPHPLAQYDLAQGARIVYVSNDTFAQAANLIDPAEPFFDPKAFGPMGKIMDSWESVRHNPLDRDTLEMELAQSCELAFAEVSTKWHDGNQAPAVSIEARASPKDAWTEVLPRSNTQGHAMHRYVLGKAAAGRKFKFVRVHIYPDGGLTRVRLYGPSLPAALVSTFPFEGRFKDPIPAVEKATSLYEDHSVNTLTPATALRLLRDASLSSSSNSALLNVAVGGSIVEVSNQHYGPAAAILSPGPPRGMHDGFETRRARAPGAVDFVTVKLLVPAHLARVAVDFAFFINNSPSRMSIEGSPDGATWFPIFAESSVKSYRGNVLHVSVPPHLPRLSQVRVRCFPCGGFNRLHCLATAAEVRDALVKAKL
jgi:allantoicase/CubicO group peptidase (beta-lactamase class C family)